MMKVGFVGVGSIARRHINNLVEICRRRNQQVMIDLYRSGVGTVSLEGIEDKINKVYNVVDSISEHYDAIFITNPTNIHYETLLKFQSFSKGIFIEKPVFDRLDIDYTKIDMSKICYVACPLRYTGVIQYLKKNLDISSVYSVRSICSSYLPDWRKGIDYRNTYSAHRNSGGGVAIDLIHEWDYLTYIFGMPKGVMSIKTRVSNLEVDSDDLAVYLANYDNKVIELHLDYFGRHSIREMQIFCENETILCDLIQGKINFMSTKQEILFKEERDTYQIRELECFLDILMNNKDNQNDIYHACNILRLARGED